jgi:hypothetical protein
LNTFNNIANPCVSYAFRTCHKNPSLNLVQSARRHSRRTVSLHPVQRSYAAPTIGMLRNCARNPRSWCGTSPSTLPSSCWDCWVSCPGGGAGAWRLQSGPMRQGIQPSLRNSRAYPKGC